MGLSGNRRFILILSGILLGLAVQSQEPVEVNRSDEKVILGGKVYYIHTVKPGQTLYSISRAYGVSGKEISIENPGVSSGIVIGQALKIPVEPSLEQEIDTSVSVPEEGVRLHRIEPGETLFSISRQYGTDEEALLEANPGIRPEELRPGDSLVIPEAEPSKPKPSFDEEGYAIHRVKRRETLYSIAKFYEVSVEDIRAANPELGWGGPKAGQVIRIPLPQVTQQPEPAPDTLIYEELLQGGADTLEIYRYEELEREGFDPDRTYRIAYLIPFDFREPEPLDSLLKDVESPARRNQITERYRMEQRVPQSVPFLEFFQGSLLALDSMREAGMKLEVRYFDTQKSMSRTSEILRDDFLEDADLLIGPFYPFNLEVVEGFALREGIPLVTPFINDIPRIRTHPYLFQLSPSLLSGYRELAKLVAFNHTANIVYVREEDSLNMEKHRVLQELIFDGFDDYRPDEPVVFKEMTLTLDHTDEIVHSLVTDRKNLVVVPTRNEALASRVVSTLFYHCKDYDIEVVGTPYWTEFSSINSRYYHQLKLVFYNPFWMNYLDPGVDSFLRKFREYFNAEPRSMTRSGINYGIAGYDITLFFAGALNLYGPRFILSLDRYSPQLVIGPYRFERVSRSGGFENRHIPFYQYMPDMSIRPLEVPDLPKRDFFFRPWDDGRRKFMLHKRENGSLP